MSELTSLIKLIKSSDGSHTLYRTDLDEHYHSVHGAKQESKHVFIEAGLNDFIKSYFVRDISILEIGMGTGLNAFLTFLFIKNSVKKIAINYTTLEPFPLPSEIVDKLNYPISVKENDCFLKIHNCEWEETQKIIEGFSINKKKTKLEDFNTNERFDVIYYDAFSPNSQEEMWGIDQFNTLFDLTKTNGRLVTYCAKGQVRRNLQQVGYQVERLKGPKGKREMLRAIKI